MRVCTLVLVLSSLAVAQVPHSKHVWIIAEENHSYETVVGSSSMPYFNSLANKYGLATQYYSTVHNSISALMWLVAGQSVTGNNLTTQCYNVNNIVRQLLAQGLTWKSYQVDLPYAGFQGTSWLNYVRRHNPIIDFTDSCAASQVDNSVPYSQLAIDIANNRTPNYVWITPDLQDDAHDGTLSQADAWLSQNVPAILARPEFAPGGDGILFIVWDEGNVSGDNRCSSRVSNGCGGRTATLVIGPQVKRGFQSNRLYAHQNLLRTVCDAMRLTSSPGATAVSNPMSDFFNTVSIAAPLDKSQVFSPVSIQATTSNSSTVTAVQVYVDNVLRYTASGNQVNTSVPMTAGQHHVVVQSWDATGGIHRSDASITVAPQAAVMTSPTANTVVPPQVPIVAIAGGANPVSTMHVYVDSTLKYQVSGSQVKTTLSLNQGQHNIVVEALDQAGGITKTGVNINVQTPSITISSPGSSIYPPVQVSTNAVDPSAINMTQIYLDNALVYEGDGPGIQVPMSISQGSHWFVVKEWNAAGASYSKGLNINVVPVPVYISSPKANTTVNSPVQISASTPSTAVTVMQVYVDNVLTYHTSGTVVNTALAMSAGSHYVVVQAWDTAGQTWKTGININVQ